MRIERLFADKRGSQRIQFSDGTSFFCPLRIISDYALYSGKELDDQEYDSLLTDLKESEVRKKGMDLIARSEHSAGMLRKKLVSRNYDAEVVEKVIREFQEERFVDDKRYAEMWTRSRIDRRQEGKGKLVSELTQRFVDKHIAEEVVSAMVSESIENDSLELLGERLQKKKNMTKEKLGRKLASRGFPSNLIYRYLEKLDLPWN
ncbi:MAG: regulatory protein RecX [Spirochaetia bacterium]